MPQLDALRAFAVAGVAISHWVPKSYQFGLPWWAGVELFFVLSGFLITGILLRCRDLPDVRYSLRAFYMRRFLRIFPLFYGVLFAAVVLDLPPVRETFWWHVTYLSNFQVLQAGVWPGMVSHFWSLAVEEQFYLLWPAIILFLPAGTVVRAVAGLCVVGCLSKYGLKLILTDNPMLGVLPTSAFVALGLGAALACARGTQAWGRLGRILGYGLPVYALLFGIKILAFRDLPHSSLEDLPLVAGLAWLVYRASDGFDGLVGTIMTAPGLLYLGKISYGLYVLHNFAGFPVAIFAKIVHVEGLRYGLVGLFLKTGFTVLGASLSWHFFERPINELKRFYPYRKPIDQDERGLTEG